MRTTRTTLLALSLALCAGTASAAHLKQDPLTQLPLAAGTDNPMAGNEPTQMPSAQVCKSQYQGNFYPVYNGTLDSTVSWYAGALKGFRHIQSADHAIHVFADAQRSLIVIVMGKPGGNADKVAYEKFVPGMAEITLLGMVKNSVNCP